MINCSFPLPLLLFRSRLIVVLGFSCWFCFLFFFFFFFFFFCPLVVSVPVFSGPRATSSFFPKSYPTDYHPVLSVPSLGFWRSFRPELFRGDPALPPTQGVSPPPTQQTCLQPQLVEIDLILGSPPPSASAYLPSPFTLYWFQTAGFSVSPTRL